MTLLHKNICINVCIIKIHVPRAHEVKNQRVIAKRTSQIICSEFICLSLTTLWHRKLKSECPYVQLGSIPHNSAYQFLSSLHLFRWIYVCIYTLYVCIYNHKLLCMKPYLWRVSRTGRVRLPFSSTWFHPPIIKQFVLFSEGPFYCLCTVSLTDLVHSYLELF